MKGHCCLHCSNFFLSTLTSDSVSFVFSSKDNKSSNICLVCTWQSSIASCYVFLFMLGFHRFRSQRRLCVDLMFFRLHSYSLVVYLPQSISHRFLWSLSFHTTASSSSSSGIVELSKRSDLPSRPQHHWSSNFRPYFEPREHDRNVTAQVGKSTFLRCRIRQITDETVSLYTSNRFLWWTKVPTHSRFLRWLKYTDDVHDDCFDKLEMKKEDKSGWSRERV